MKFITASGASIIRILHIFFCGILLVAAGCASAPKRTVLPAELVNRSTISGVTNVRFWGDEWPKFSQDIIESSTQEELQLHFSGVYGTPHNYLAISGGGAEGAFGAGLLTGWSTLGTRPEFTMVTGISTGALTAPFAFLGTDYDPLLKEVYTTTETSDILKKNGPIKAALIGSAADTTPLRKLIEHYVNDAVIEAIAAEHRRGRRLLIGTFNLDAARSVIWSIGAIANSDYQQKHDLIRDVLLASASIPVAFPPVLINVEVDGETYDEMHVDGGTGAQVFVYPATFEWRKIMKKFHVPQTPQVYVIRNSFLEPAYHGVIPKVIPIASRSISSLIRTQGVGDLYQIYALCNRDGNGFNLAYIPSDFTEKSTEVFDQEYMNKLYQLGFNMAVQGYQWKNVPPGFRKRE